MRQKTITIDERDAINNRFDAYQIGAEFILLEYQAENGNEWFALREHNGQGIAGNMNQSIKRYHGWRGTTNNIAKYAHGVRKIIKTTEPKQNADGFDYIRVTVGPDLHPDWE